MDKIELAKWLHDNYEEVAKQQGWNTQENCKVDFDTLPEQNKQTMIEMAKRLLNFNLLRLHFASGQVCSHPDKYLVSGVFGGYWCPKCDRNVDDDL